jgi:ADP-ribosylglycohydrolase
LSSGYYAAFIANIIAGVSVKEAAIGALRRLRERKGHEDCVAIIEKAVALAAGNLPVNRAMDEIGKGYTAEEATALAVFLSLRYTDDFDGAILAATTFKGNTDSIAPIVGNALGAYHGVSVIPQKWINELELSDLIVYGADLLLEKAEVKD